MNNEDYDIYPIDDDQPELSMVEQHEIDCATECTCGAWGWSSEFKPVHIADCICGAG